MKNGKKLTAVAAASAVASALVAPAAFAATTSFSDISGNFAETAIKDLASQGILAGNPDGTFNPSGNITREQFAVVIAKALKLDTTGTASFSDVDSWASGAVAAVNKAGYITGYDAAHFGGKDVLTREQMATIFVRALSAQTGYKADGKGANLTFSDASSISSWAKDAVGAAVELGLVHGMTDGSFAPAGHATRAQVALVASSFLAKVDELNAVSVTAAATLNSDNTATVTGTAKGGADSVKVSVDGGAATAATLNTDGTYTFMTGVLSSGSHTISVVAYKGDTASQPASATVTVGTVGVASVKATDPMHIVVAFNTPMSGDTTVGNFAVSTGTTANVVTDVSWSADGKTATLTLTDALINNDYYTVKVDKDLQDANGNVLSSSADYSTGFLWNDTTAPAVTGITNELGGVVKISFNKPLASAPTVVLNGTQVTTDVLTPGATSVTVSPANLPSSVTVGSTVSAIVTGAQDQADTDGTGTHHTMALYQGSFTYSLNAVTPVVSSLKATGETELTLTFNEPIAQNVSGTAVNTDGTTDNAAALGLLILNANGAAVTPTVVTTTDGQTFKIELPTTNVYLNGASTANLTVTVNGFEDAAKDIGNSTTQNVSLSYDAVAPELINSQYLSNGDIVFTFNKALDNETAAEIASGLTIVNNATGVSTTPTGIDAIVSGGKQVVIHNTTLMLPAGSYTFTFAAGAVWDNTTNQNGNAAFSRVITVPSTTSTSGPAVSTSVATSNVIAVTYTDQVKGGAVAGSATDVNNYKLNGQALPAGTTITLDSTQKVASIKLPSGSVASTATEVLTVSNVQTLDNQSVATYNGTVALNDNVAPKLTAAKVDAYGNLVLTFSEDINGEHDATGTQPLAADFAVTVNGVTATGLSVNNGSAENQIVLTSSNVSFASGTVVVKTASSTTGADAADNKLVTGTSVTATR